MTQDRSPIAKEGLPFIAVAAVLTLILFLFGWKIPAALGIILTLFICYFFRNPERKIPRLQNVILAPADGKIIEVGEAQERRFLSEKTMKVSIFMSLFDVHLNRSPVSGKILQMKYYPGEFYVADSEKASLRNEQNVVLVQAEDQYHLVMVQIAGVVARRIVCYPKPGDLLKRGEIFGLIRFGSRVDLYLPLTVRLAVKVGQKVKAGESIIGYRS